MNPVGIAWYLKKISNSTQTWIPSKLKNKVIRDCITSVNIMYFLCLLPQFEQIKEVCLHAGHASVHVNKPMNDVCEILGTWVSVTLEFKNVPELCTYQSP